MVFWTVYSILSTIPQLVKRRDDDKIDRLNHRFSIVLLISLAGLVTNNYHLRNPIHCWTPAHFTSRWHKYAQSMCWVNNTYYLPMNVDITRDHQPKPEGHRTIIYYQWIPLILIIQAMLFYLPCWIWRSFYCKTGMDMEDICRTASNYQFEANLEKKSQHLKILAKQMHRYLKLGHRKQIVSMREDCNISVKYFFSRICCFCCSRNMRNYLIILYLFCKILYIVNSISQIWLLNAFLGTDFHYYGVQVIYKMFLREDWHSSPRFPRVTMCNFYIRRLGNIHRYTIQCVLPFNLFNELMFFVVWVWLVVISILTILSFMFWFARCIMVSDRERYIRKRLIKGSHFDRDSKVDIALLDLFVHEYLKQDGAFVIRLVEHNTNSAITNEIVREMWEFFGEIPRVREHAENMKIKSSLADIPQMGKKDEYGLNV